LPIVTSITARGLPENKLMRRSSQKHGFSTLSEINVTPLLDLAFVLLIIFIITTPLMDKSSSLVLPSSKASADAVNPAMVQTVTISKDDQVALNTQAVSLDQLASELSAKYSSQPEIAVVVRSDRDLPVQKLVDVLDAIRRAGITKVGVVTNPPSE
jgi:biopolymer transport protein ExbD